MDSPTANDDDGTGGGGGAWESVGPGKKGSKGKKGNKGKMKNARTLSLQVEHYLVLVRVYRSKQQTTNTTHA